jgi:hypothetical protein
MGGVVAKFDELELENLLPEVVHLFLRLWTLVFAPSPVARSAICFKPIQLPLVNSPQKLIVLMHVIFGLWLAGRDFWRQLNLLKR